MGEAGAQEAEDDCEGEVREVKGFDAAALAEQLRGNPDLAQANASNEAVQELLYSGAPKASKYRAVKTTIDGITFDSKKEAAEYGRLKLLEQAGVISDLELQPRFEIHAPFVDNEGKRHRGIYSARSAYIV